MSDKLLTNLFGQTARLEIIDTILNLNNATKEDIKSKVSLSSEKFEGEWKTMIDEKIIRTDKNGYYIVNNRKPSIKKLIKIRKDILREKELEEQEMPKLKWYICGPMTGFESQNYRRELKNILKSYNQEYVDPNILEEDCYDGEATFTQEAKEKAQKIFKRDEYLIRQSDIVVAYLPRPTTGGDMELSYAHSSFIPTIVIIPKERENISPFLYKADVLLPSIPAFEENILKKPLQLKKIFNKYSLKSS